MGMDKDSIAAPNLATPEQSSDIFLREEDTGLTLIHTDGRARCELRIETLANVEIYYPTASQMGVRARMRIVAGGLYYSPAWHHRLDQAHRLLRARIIT
jgi:hypothetical protein